MMNIETTVRLVERIPENVLENQYTYSHYIIEASSEHEKDFANGYTTTFEKNTTGGFKIVEKTFSHSFRVDHEYEYDDAIDQILDNLSDLKNKILSGYEVTIRIKDSGD